LVKNQSSDNLLGQNQSSDNLLDGLQLLAEHSNPGSQHSVVQLTLLLIPITHALTK
jgi:hypothetical protein